MEKHETPLVRLSDEDLPRASTRVQLVHALRHFSPGDVVTRSDLEVLLPERSWVAETDPRRRTIEICSRLSGMTVNETPLAPEDQGPYVRKNGPEPFPACLRRVGRGKYEILPEIAEPQTPDERTDGLPRAFHESRAEIHDSRPDPSLLTHVRQRALIPDSIHDHQLERIVQAVLELQEERTHDSD